MERKRVELIYCAGDNTLSSTIELIAEQVRQGWQYTANRCIIYFDAIDAPPKLYTVRGGCSTYPTPFLEEVESYEEENSASAEVFGRVVNRVRELFPADSYGLIFTSFASGWLPFENLNNPTKSVGQDNNTDAITSVISEINLSEFANAIDDGEFDYIIFEASLMAGIEVAYELKDKTKYIVASSAELLSNGFVPVYASAHRRLMDSDIPLDEALKSFAQEYYDYANAKSGTSRSATLSVIKTSELLALSNKVKGVFVSQANDDFDINSIQRFDRPDSYEQYPTIPRFFDFGDYLEQISTPEQYEQIEKQLAEVVIWKGATPTIYVGNSSFEVKRHSGLTTYIPQKELSSLNEDYSKTAWYKDVY